MKLFRIFKNKYDKKLIGPEIVSNNTIEKIEGNLEKISVTSSTTLFEILNFLNDNSSKLGIHLNKPARDADIENFIRVKMQLPEDFKLFYKFCDGFETEEDLFRLVPLREILKSKSDDYLISDNCFHFAEYMVYCDMWSVEINANNAVDYRIYNKANDVVYLTSSLAEFLWVFLSKGLYEGLCERRNKII